VTKSGTNNIHGALYGFFRDQALNATNAVEEQNGGVKSPYSRQQFGGSIGGPVKKDKAFLSSLMNASAKIPAWQRVHRLFQNCHW